MWTIPRIGYLLKFRKQSGFQWKRFILTDLHSLGGEAESS